MNIRVAFLGKQGSGKTQLIERLALKDAEFKDHLRASVGADFLVRAEKRPNNKKGKDKEPNLFQLWDFPGREQYEPMSEPFLKYSQIGVICVDLTTDIDESYIQKKIECFRQYNPDSPIILVGTKEDSPDAKLDHFNELKEN